MRWLATAIDKEERGWKEIYREKTLLKLRKKLSKVELRKPGTKSLQFFFTKRMHKVQGIVALPSATDDMLHEVRKMLKDMLYIRQWCKKNWPAGFNVTAKFSLPQLEKLVDLAGNYNDNRTAMLLIDGYLKEEKSDREIKAARSVQKKQARQKVILKKQLLVSLIQFCKRVQPSYSIANS